MSQTPGRKTESARRTRTIKQAPSSRDKERRSGKSLKWEFRLYVADQTPKSKLAFVNLKRICEEHLRLNFRIKVIDLLEKPHLAKDDQILVVPTLIRIMPEPVRTIIGDLSNTERALAVLGLQPQIAREAM